MLGVEQRPAAVAQQLALPLHAGGDAVDLWNFGTAQPQRSQRATVSALLHQTAKWFRQIENCSIRTSFRGKAKPRTRNPEVILREIPGLVLAHHPGMTRWARPGRYQLTRFQVWPPQNMPPKAQPWTRSALVPFIAIVES